MIDFDIPKQRSSIIKVIGVGGGGGNAVNHMFSQHIENVDFIICNTDAQALENSKVPNKIQLGPHLTQGLGAGANPEVGRQATQESLEEIKRILEINTKMAFICAGMGGGTGTGGTPIIAKICQELGILTVGIVTTPFSFEGPKRKNQAEAGIRELEPHVDTLLVISNDKLRVQHKDLKMREAFGKADDVLSTAAKCITDIINSNGQINVDFADVCTVMRKGGVAILGSAVAEGEDRAQRAIEDAINSPLLNDNDICGAKWILLNINTSEGDYECGTNEFELINDFVRRKAGASSDVIVGMGLDESLNKGLAVTLIATGFAHKDPFEQKPDFETVAEEDKEKVTLTLDDSPDAAPVVFPIKEEAQIQNPKENKTLEELPSVEPVLSEEPLKEEIIETVTKNVTVEKETLLLFPLQEDADEFQSPKLNLSAKEEPKTENKVEEEYQPETAPAHTFLSRPSNIYAVSPTKGADDFSKEGKPQSSVTTIIPQQEDEGLEIVYKENTEVNQSFAVAVEELTEEEIKRKKAEERIQKLRNLTYDASGNKDLDKDLENIPAYMRRSLEMLDAPSNVAENFYSRYTVNKDEKNGTNISSLNAFLEGKKPD